MVQKNVFIKTSARGTERTSKKLNKVDKSLNRMRVSTKGLQRSLGVLRNRLLLLTFAFAGFAAFVRKTTDAYRLQLEAQTRLIAGLRNVEDATPGAAEKLFKYASALQQMTTFGDEYIISAMAMLSTFQLNETQIAKLIPRILDMAAASGTKPEGLTSIAILMGKAFTGQIGSLSRYGVILDKTKLKTARLKGEMAEFNFLLGEMDKNFRGAAEALRSTLLGEIDAMQMEIGDLNEELGRNLLPTLKFWTELKLSLAKSIRWTILAMSDEYTMTEAFNKIQGETIQIQEELLKLRMRTIKTRDIEMDQSLILLDMQKTFLETGGGIDIEEQKLLINQRQLDVQELYNNALITNLEKSRRILLLDIELIKLGNQKSSTAKTMARFASQTATSLMVSAISGDNLGEALKRAVIQLAVMVVQAKLFAYFMTIGTGGANVASAAAVTAIVGFKEGGQFTVPKYQGGGQFMVGGRGGADSQIVMFKASPDERITIETPAQQIDNSRIENHFHFHGIISQDFIDNEFIPALNESQVSIA